MEDELKRKIQNAIATSITLTTGGESGVGKMIAGVSGYDIAADKVMEVVAAHYSDQSYINNKEVDK